MTTTRVPSEAELIELENWAFRLNQRFERASADWRDDNITTPEWHKRYPELPLYPPDRARLFDNLLAVLDLARAVKNPGK